jgi:hypothetical protein
VLILQQANCFTDNVRWPHLSAPLNLLSTAHLFLNPIGVFTKTTDLPSIYFFFFFNHLQTHTHILVDTACHCVEYLPLMALITLPNAGDNPPRRRLQPEVSEKTARILKAAAKLTDRHIGHIIDDLVADSLEKLMDVEALVASQSIQEDDDAA